MHFPDGRCREGCLCDDDGDEVGALRHIKHLASQFRFAGWFDIFLCLVACYDW